MSIQTLSPSQAYTNTQSVFGRKVKEKEFDQFKKDVVATYKDSGFEINPDDIDINLCSKRYMLPIPIIGWLIGIFEARSDGRRVNSELKKIKLEDDQNKDVLLITHNKKTLPYWKKMTNLFNGNFDTEEKQQEFTKLIKPAISKSLDAKVELKNVAGHAVHAGKRNNQRYSTFKYTLGKKEEVEEKQQAVATTEN